MQFRLEKRLQPSRFMLYATPVAAVKSPALASNRGCWGFSSETTLDGGVTAAGPAAAGAG